MVDTDRGGARGLCARCYGTFGRSVRNGETTWEAIEAAGLCDPVKIGGRPSLARALIEKMRGEK